MAEEYTQQPRIGPALLVLVVSLVGLVYLALSLSTADPLWFWPRVEAQARRIVIYSQGRCTELTPGMPGYTELNAAINASLSSIEGYFPAWGLSEESLKEARTRYLTIEVFYDAPVQVHSTFRTGRPNTILIPLTGRGSEASLVFFGSDGHYWPGAPKVGGLERIRELITQMGY